MIGMNIDAIPSWKTRSGLFCTCLGGFLPRVAGLKGCSPAARGAAESGFFCFLHNFFVITPFSPIFAATSSYFRPLSHHPIISSFILHEFSLKLNQSFAVSPVILQDLACNFAILAHITCHSSFSDKYLTPDKSTHNTH